MVYIDVELVLFSKTSTSGAMCAKIVLLFPLNTKSYCQCTQKP